ncbi:glucan endo-1,3-beta-D-glucosidase [Trifolium repens]|nr:glucan endo-1,3-beta-D-glucosidase [Trifolium repens]
MIVDTSGIPALILDVSSIATSTSQAKLRFRISIALIQFCSSFNPGLGLFLANDTTNQTYCIAMDGFDSKTLQATLDWACGPWRANCSKIQPGESYYKRNNVKKHASYAFDSYYQKEGKAPRSCDFKGVAMITTTNPIFDFILTKGRRLMLNWNVLLLINTFGKFGISMWPEIFMYGKVLKVSMSQTAAVVVQQFPNNTCSVNAATVVCIAEWFLAIPERLVLEQLNIAMHGSNMPSSNPDCVYLHEVGSQEDSFTKDEVVSAYTWWNKNSIRISPLGRETCLSAKIVVGA